MLKLYLDTNIWNTTTFGSVYYFFWCQNIFVVYSVVVQMLKCWHLNTMRCWQTMRDQQQGSSKSCGDLGALTNHNLAMDIVVRWIQIFQSSVTFNNIFLNPAGYYVLSGALTTAAAQGPVLEMEEWGLAGPVQSSSGSWSASLEIVLTILSHSQIWYMTITGLNVCPFSQD